MKEIKYLFLFIFLVIPLLMVSSYGSYELSGPRGCILIVLCLLVIFFIYQQNSFFKNLWYKPSNVFLLSFLIVNFQYIIDLSLGFKQYSFFFYPRTVNDTAVISVCGLLSFMIGYFLVGCFFLKKQKNRNGISYENEDNILDRKAGVIKLHLLTLLQVAFFVLWILTVNIFALLSGLSYSDDSLTSSTAGNFETLFYCATLAILVTAIYNSRLIQINGFLGFFKSISIVSWIVIGLYCAIRAVSGDRGPFMYTLLAIFFAYIMVTKVKIRTWKLILPLLLFALLINFIGIARSGDLNQSMTDRIINAISELTEGNESRFNDDKTILTSTEELAISEKCNEIAVEMIKYRGDKIHGGMYFFTQVLECIPFMSNVVQNKIGLSEYEWSSDFLLTDDYAGRHDLYQIGTTIIADSYLDIGLWGVVLILFITGGFYYWVDSGVLIKTPRSEWCIILILLFASLAIYIPRSTFVIQFKNFIPICVLFYLNKKIYITKIK